MDWKKQWIDQVLAEIPEGRYRVRTEAELCDHLETRRRALMEAGRTGDEAETEALGAMGEPGKLKAEYRAAWRRTPESRLWAAAGWLGGTALAGIVLYATFGLVLAASLAVTALTEGDLASNQTFLLVEGGVAFWVPFLAAGALLGKCLQHYRCRGALIAAGLLLIWAMGTAVLVVLILGMGEYDQYGLLPPGWPDRLALFYQDMRHTNAPWITPGYHLMNIGGCVFLGWLFGRPAKAEKPAAA